MRHRRIAWPVLACLLGCRGDPAAHRDVRVLVEPAVIHMAAPDTCGTRLVARTVPLETPQRFSWRSSDLRIVTVNDSGLIWALEGGRAVITALWSGDTLHRGSAQIDVLYRDPRAHVVRAYRSGTTDTVPRAALSGVVDLVFLISEAGHRYAAISVSDYHGGRVLGAIEPVEPCTAPGEAERLLPGVDTRTFPNGTAWLKLDYLGFDVRSAMHLLTPITVQNG